MDKLKAFLFQNTNPKQTIAKNTIWLFIGEIIGRLLKLAIVVFATRKLGVEGWGLFSYSLAFVSFFYMLGDFGINTFLTRELAKDPDNKSKYLSTAVIIKTTLLLVFFIVALVVGPHIGKITLSIQTVIVFSLFFILESFREFAMAINRSLEKFEREGFSKILVSSTITILGIILILHNPQPLSLALAYMMSSLIATVYIFLCVRNQFHGLKWSFSKVHFKSIYAFSWPLIIISLFAFLFNIDSIMLGQMKSAHEVGLYAASQRLVQFLNIIPGFIATATFPLLSKYSEDNTRLAALFEKTLLAILGIAIPIVISGLFYGYNIIHLILGSEYTSAVPAFAILLLTILASFPNILLNNLIFSKNLQRIFITASSVGVVANIGLNFWLIPQYGANGAALATVIASVLITIINWIRMKKFVSFSVLPRMGKIILANFFVGAFLILTKLIKMPVLLVIPLTIGVYSALLYFIREPTFRQILAITKNTTYENAVH